MNLKTTVLISVLLTACGTEQTTEPGATEPSGACLERVLEPSQQVLAQMQSAGLDLGEARLVTHLFVGSEAAIESAAKKAPADGMVIAELSENRLVYSEMVPFVDDWTMRALPTMCDYAELHGLSYDGWDVDVSEEGLS